MERGICEHQLNDSPTKQHYSFPKAQRFRFKKTENDLYYDLPSTLKKQGYSFANARRAKGREHHGGVYIASSPPPGTYDPISIYTKFNGWSFGASKQKREQTSGIDGVFPPDKSLPGPGTYNVIPKDFGRNAHKFTMRPRTQSSKHYM